MSTPDFSIPLSIPNLSGNEWRYVKECLDSGWVSSAGKYVDLFEQNIAEYTGSKYAVACVNGTYALYVSLKLIGVEAGDEVIVPTLTFIAPVNAVSYSGAVPVFMDCDEYFNLDTAKTIDFILNQTETVSHNYIAEGAPVTINKQTGKRIIAIIPVHIWGNAAKLDELVPLCEERGIAVVEDASESLGTIYKAGLFSGKHTGTIGRLGCISFNGNKIITAGGGGMILTDDYKLAEKARYLTNQAKDDPVKYIHDEIGYNLRLSNIHAALGMAQLEQLQMFLKRKKDIHRKYNDAIEKIEGLSLTAVPDYAENNHWLNLLQIDRDVYGSGRDRIMTLLGKKGIQTRPVWSLNHMQRPYKDHQIYKIERAGKLVEKSLCLPSSTNLNHSEIDTLINLLSS